MSDMRRAVLLLLAIVVSSAVGALIVRRVHREVTYSRTMKWYSDVLKPGMSRREVEAHLNARNPGGEIARMGGLGGGELADLVQIGKEEPSWICQRRNIYVAFHFNSTEPHDDLRYAYANDRLNRVSLFRSDCLDLP